MKKNITIIFAVIVVILLATTGGLYFYHQKPGNQRQACTLEAKICPDGTAVGRSGPNCGFAACPVASGATKACVDSGGVASTTSCCNSINDFPNSCVSNICNCLPSDLRSIKICDCGKEKCFNGSKCVSPSLKVTIYCTNNNCAPQETLAGAAASISGCYSGLKECQQNVGKANN